MSLESYTHKPQPKRPKGILFQVSLEESSDFDLNAFMKQFKKQKVEVPEPLVDEPEMEESEEVNLDEPRTVKQIIEFTVKKLGMIHIGHDMDQLPETSCEWHKPPVSTTPYYMSNRLIFRNQLKSLFAPYKDKKDVVTCNSMKEGFRLLTHQKVIKDYMQIETPHRGILLYHGLGSGKTCSSIAIAEQLKHYAPIIVLTPASLETNYISELKKCGDFKYHVDQHWEWMSNKHPEIQSICKEMCFTEADIKKQKGIWHSSEGESNFSDLSVEEQNQIRTQIDLMIKKHYQFIHYNGIRKTTFFKKYGTDPFSNKVVIVDEAHNLVSRIVNKMKKIDSLSMQIYDLLMKATNCRIVLLSGTPMINYPHELGILFNILRGYIQTWQFSLSRSVPREQLEPLLRDHPEIDTVQYEPYDRATKIIVTRNPQGFTSLYDPKYSGMICDNRVPDEDFGTSVAKLLKDFSSTYEMRNYKALPDNEKDFGNFFIQDGKFTNKVLFMHRILGLCSYFPDLSNLMPELKDIVLHKIPMSTYQASVYAAKRYLEQDQKPTDDDEKNGTYRIFSRLACNCVFPKEILRPGLDMAVDKLGTLLQKLKTNVSEDEEEDNDIDMDISSKQSITKFYKELNEWRHDDNRFTDELETYSPKYKEMLETIQQKEGLQLIYSQFLTIEGLGVFGIVLDENDFTEFKLKRQDQRWEIDVPVKDRRKRMYVKYIGTKSLEEKEVLRNIFNRDVDKIPEHLKEAVALMNIDIFMITSAGAEGISLKGVQYVHIMEPYWNPVRLDQVIGRARRICSHTELNKEEQFVEAHIYLMTIPKDFLTKLPRLARDTMDIDKSVEVVSTDEYLYEVSKRKQRIQTDMLSTIQSSSIDCFLHSSNCFPYTTEDPNVLSYHPNIDSEPKDVDRNTNVEMKTAKFSLKNKDGTTDTVQIQYSPAELVDYKGKKYHKLYHESAHMGYLQTDNKNNVLNLDKEPIQGGIVQLYMKWKK
jgi:hypothetical protein